MKVPLSWLKDYVDIEVNAEELAEKLLLSGTKVEEVIKDGDDYILDLEITSNRPDCLGVLGVAREISAVLGVPLKNDSSEQSRSSGELDFVFNVADPTLLPSYSAVVLEHVNIGESNDLIKSRLTKCGVRPINSLVDVTNYVMLETGQPMHAFDYDKVSGHTFNVRSSREGEEVTTIDGVKRKLKEGSIIIEDTQKLIDLAGLMGGANTEITQDTTRTLIFFPVFDPVRIRKTSGYLNFRTEASNRLEKLLDPEGPALALSKAVRMLEKESSAVVASRVETKQLVENPSTTLEVSLELIKDFLGVEMTSEEVQKILKSLGFETSELPLSDQPTLRVVSPSWRRDIHIAEDIVEEVGRIYGYNNLPSTLPSGTPPARSEAPDFEFTIKTILTGWGLNEAITYTLVSKKEIENILKNPLECSKVLDPMSVDFEYLRPSLLMGLLNNAVNNQRLGFNLSFFEIGRVFGPEFSHENLLTNQNKRLSAVVIGEDFGKVKGVIESLFKKLKIKEVPNFLTYANPLYTDSINVEINVNERNIGSLGLLRPEITANFDLSGDWYHFDLDLSALLELIPNSLEYTPLPKYPSVIQDISFVVAQNTPVGDILKTIKNSGGELLNNLELLDVYTGEKVGESKKSITVRLYFQAEDRTLTDEQVQPIHQTISNSLVQEHQASVR